MIKRKRLLKVVLFLLCLTMSMGWQAYAAEKLTDISIKVTNEFRIGERCSENDVTVETQNSKYYVEEVEILNEIDVWGNTDVPRIEVTLRAESGYFFSVNRADVTVKDAKYVNKRQGKDAYTLILIVQTDSLTGQVGEITYAGWESQTVAGWNKAYNTGYYEVSLYRNGSKTGSTQRVQENQYDFAPLMRRAGDYTYKVRAVNVKDSSEKSQWYEVWAVTTVDEAAAEQFRARYGNQIPEGVTEPGQIGSRQELTYGWIEDSAGWWYRNPDGGYTTDSWQLIDDKWYYFNSKGYMVTGWIDWKGKSYYCRPGSGDMLTNAVVPDGSGRRVDSSGAWIS